MKKQIKSMGRSYTILLAVFMALGIAHTLFAPPITYLVTTNADAGAGSLRDAINTTNANVGFTNTINFNFLGGPIVPLSDLPTITNPVIIDAYFGAPGGATPNTNPITAANNAVVSTELRGPGAGVDLPVLNGLVLGAGSSGSIIRGLSINNFASVPSANINDGGAGIRIESDNNIIEGNFVGTDTTGTQSFPNFSAIRISGNNNLIGGTLNTARNLLSGMYGGTRLTSWYNGVVKIDGQDNILNLNTIGLNRAGTAGLQSDSTVGVVTSQATGTIVGGPSHTTHGNVISGHRFANVFFNLAEGTQTIQGNYIGTDVTGTTAVATGGQPISSNGNGIVLIGGFINAPQHLLIDGNIISGNTAHGIRVGENGFSLYPIIGASITNNFIGTNASGSAGLPNGLDGIRLNFAQDTYIANNVISANGNNGIHAGKDQHSIIRNNFIGTDNSGTVALGNGRNGIKLGVMLGAGVPSFADVVGGAKFGEGNLISNNGTNGIELVSTAQEETIIGNTITNNEEHGILIGQVSSFIWVGSSRNETDLRVIGNLSDQEFTNLGPLGNSNIINNNGLQGIKAVADSYSNTIQSNIITSNGSAGIDLIDSSFNLVGGKFGGATISTSTPPVLGNIIQENNGNGVGVIQNEGAATDNAILSNSIYNNSAKGIALITE
jgi:parallel beta-helix repeat protein